MPLPPVAPVREPRATCARCRRPERVCYCAKLPRLETRTKVVILQHPRERTMPIGTARMASLALPGAELHVGRFWDGHPALARALGDPARPPILLYPGEGAKDILREPPVGPVTLVVVDGTWWHAKTIVRDSAVLRGLPRYAFATPEPSQYRIRSEPSDEYTSTLEALMHTLGALEGDPVRFRALLEPFRAMVDAQLACQASASPEERRFARRRRGGLPRAPEIPAAIHARAADLVCVAAEASAWPYRDGPARPESELLHWVAERVATGERFDEVIAPRAPLAENTAFHIGLGAERLAAGGSAEELARRFAGWVRPSDVLCTWGYHGPNLFLAAGGVLPAETIDVRAVARREARRKIGRLEEYAASLGPAPAPAPVGSGRAGRRLALLGQIVRAWQSK